jgi:hypothetical protein
MDFKVMRHFAYGCERVFSADRWALTGEAGVFTDPLYSPGSEFIAIGNTFISDLILRELEGEDITERVERHNGFYLGLFSAAINLFTRQYPILGNARAVVMKGMWDQAFWWSMPALLFFRNKLTDLDFMASIRPELENHFRVDGFVQALFREWDRIEHGEFRDGWITLKVNEFPFQLHVELALPFNDEELLVKISANVRQMEAVAACYLEGAMRRTPALAAQTDLCRRAEQTLGPDEHADSRRALVPPDLERVWLDRSELLASHGA